MKKLLLILMAFLAFAPPHLHAEVITTTFFSKTATESPNLTFGDGASMKDWSSTSSTVSSKYVSNTTASSFKYIYRNQGSSENFLDDCLIMEFTKTAGAKYNAFTKFGLEIFRGNTFVIKAKYGKVHRVQLYYGTGYSSGAGSASAGTATVKNAKDLLTFNTDTKQNQAVMVVTNPAMFQTSTPANQKANEYFEFTYKTTLSTSYYPIYFSLQKIIVTWEPVELPKPGLPTIIEPTADSGDIFNKETNEYSYSATPPVLKFNKDAAADKLVYTINNENITESSTEYTDNGIDLSSITTATTIRIAGVNSKGLGEVLTITVNIKKPDAPTLDTNGINTTDTSIYPYFVDGKYGYISKVANIKINRPAGAETVYYTTDGTQPNIYSRTLGEDNTITLSETVVGQKTKVILTAANRGGMSTEALTIDCERFAVPTPSRPEIRKVSQSFTSASVSGMLRLQPSDFANYNNSGIITLENDKVVLEMAKAYANSYTGILQGEIHEPQSAFIEYALTRNETLTSDAKFYRASTFASQHNWGGIYVDQHKWVALSNKDVNPIGLFNGYNEIYLHLRATSITGKNDNGENLSDKNSELYTVSDVLTVKLVRKAPGAPELKLNVEGGAKGTWNDRGGVASLSYMGSSSIVATKSSPGYSIEYCFVAAEDGKPWPGSNPDKAPITEIQNQDQTSIIALGSSGADAGKAGRLYVRQNDKAHTLPGEWAMLDVEPIHVDDYKLNDLNARPAQQALVRLTQDDAYGMKVMGVYKTDAAAVNSKKTYYVYLMDQWGNPIKLVVNAQSMPKILEEYADTEGGTKTRLIKGDVIGRIYYHSITGEGNKMPEIWVTPGSEDYTDYLPASEATEGWATSGKAPADILEQPTVGVDNFNRKMRLRSLTWLGSNRVRTADGIELTLYSRLKVEGYDFQDDMEKVAAIANKGGTKLFAATGFVGQLNGQLALLTTENTLQCPGTPNLSAPNPISGQPDADGFVAVNAISDEVKITITGNAHGESKFCWASNEEGNNTQPITNNTLTIKRPTGSNDTVKRVIWSELNGMRSLNPAKVKFIFHTPEKVASIEEFKTKEFANFANPDAGQTEYYQMTGKAIVEEITPEYLYVRDYNDSPMAELIEDEHMHRMLIHNSNGWNALVADPDGGEARPLKKNDVITGFAIHPQHKNGNLLSESTGFARTFKVDKHDAAYSFAPEEIQAAPTDNFLFEEIHRMRLVTLKGVEVKRTTNTGADREEYPYNYTLQIDGTPRMRMDVFRRSGFAEAYAENTGFDLTGVVLLDSDNGTDKTFSFALLSFEGSAKVAMPEVYLDGIADKTLTEQPFVAGTIKMDAVKLTTDGAAINESEDNKVTIHYSIDGLDPLQNLGSRHEYEEGADELKLADHDVEIRAFASYPGMTPSDVVVRRFRKQSNDVQYILNFLNTAREGNAYRFTSSVKAVAKGGDYLFVAGSVGHYLPIYREGGWGNMAVKPGQYLKGFTVGYKVDEYGNRMAVATGYEHTFGNVADDGESVIKATPDEVSSISAANARRLVRISNVRVNAAGGRSGEWTITELSDGQTHPLMAGLLGEVEVTDAEGNPTGETLQDGETYNITGFVMLGELRTVPSDPEDADSEPTVESTVEFWPMSAVRVTRSAPVTAEMTNLAEEPVTDENGDIRATFNGMTEVSLSTTGHNATIYYWLESEETDESKATWYTYQRPFIITGQEKIHAKSQAEGMAESDHTHVILTPATMSGDVEFSVNAEPGMTTVTITAAAGSEIWYSTGTAGCDKRYTAGQKLTFEEETMLYACAKAPGMGRGPVSRMLVMVKEATPDDIETTGNILQFSQEVTEEGFVKVTIEAVTPVAGGTIYYTTEAGKKLPGEGVRYDGPVVMKESGVIIAVMVIGGRPASQTYETNVWVVPVVTGIEDVDADRQESVRAEGNDIVAPAGSEVYDIAGRRVRPTGLASGIYIVRTPDGKAVKVRI